MNRVMVNNIRYGTFLAEADEFHPGNIFAKRAVVSCESLLNLMLTFYLFTYLSLKLTVMFYAKPEHY